MSDIVEMLKLPTGCVPPSKWELMAAKEIEQLRAALFKIQCQQLDRGTNTEMTAKQHRAKCMATRDLIIGILEAD